MQRSLTSLCTLCRHSIFTSSSHTDPWLLLHNTPSSSTARPYITKRFRGAQSAKSTTSKYSRAGAVGTQERRGPQEHESRSRGDARRNGRGGGKWSAGGALDMMEPEEIFYRGPSAVQQHRLKRTQKQDAKALKISPSGIPAFFESNVAKWAEDPLTLSRLNAFGFPPAEARPLLQAFTQAVQAGQLSDAEGIEKYHLVRFTQPIDATAIPMIYSTVFFHWASTFPPPPAEHGIDPAALKRVRRLAEAADKSYPAERYVAARRMRRKIIMHVGPTNSGKTHHALRALAAAKTGVYAGPLRLLAHEIWERLNLGQIVPQGMDAEVLSSPEPDNDTDTGTALDGVLPGTVPAVRRLGNWRFARQCNMLTGEEQKIVDEECGLLSCTVEMLSMNATYDVAVVDEIQMIADEQRGWGWTNAVLGLCAHEVHLCGEETAVPVIQELLKYTGDELIVNRYQRLTPLVVEEESLQGDWGKVRKGDCIVTFRRSNIFAIKKEVEEKTGMRCAVVYGKLPPEIRSEQAALFNDPESGYDVIIGSDAIGMGLNLKIRRMIFESVAKVDNSGRFRHLTISSVKQIAGRAGRFGLHADAEAGGYTTTLHAADLPFLRDTLDVAPDPLAFARLAVDDTSFSALANVLPPTASTATVFDAHLYISRTPPTFRYTVNSALEDMGTFIDTRGAGLTLADRTQFMNAPVSWRDSKFLQVTDTLLKLYAWNMSVRFRECVAGTEFVKTLEGVEELMRKGAEPRATSAVLDVLETFHKTTVLYMWLSFRNPVAYSDHEEVAVLKTRIEAALDWCLEGMSRQMASRKPEGRQVLGREAWKEKRKEGSLDYRTSADVRLQDQEKWLVKERRMKLLQTRIREEARA